MLYQFYLAIVILFSFKQILNLQLIIYIHINMKYSFHHSQSQLFDYLCHKLLHNEISHNILTHNNSFHTTLNCIQSVLF